jgi:hypothetical protein
MAYTSARVGAVVALVAGFVIRGRSVVAAPKKRKTE